MADVKRLGFGDVDFGDELPEKVSDISLATVQIFPHAAGLSFRLSNDHQEARTSVLPGSPVPGLLTTRSFAAANPTWPANRCASPIWRS